MYGACHADFTFRRRARQNAFGPGGQRPDLMRFLGARVVLTPAALKGTGMLAKARELAEEHGWFWCRLPAMPPDPQALSMLDLIIRNPDAPVVMFALEWCEFCWSLRRLFADMDVPYRSVDLDSVAYQKDDLGGALRAALRHRLGSPRSRRCS